jgi:hypothetical protein
MTLSGSKVAQVWAKKTPAERAVMQAHARGEHTAHRLDCPVCRKFGVR